MRITILPLAVILSASLFLSACNLVFANDSVIASPSATPEKTIEQTIGQAKIQPASFLYFLKMFKEDLELKEAKTNAAKALKFLEFANRRIREVQSLITVNRQDLIEPTLERYWTHLQDVKGSFNVSDLKMNSDMGYTVYEHLYIMLKVYPTLTNNRAKIAIRRTIFHLSTWIPGFAQSLATIHQDDLVRNMFSYQKIACDFLTKEASDSALNETERGVFADRAGKCPQTLETNSK